MEQFVLGVFLFLFHVNFQINTTVKEFNQLLAVHPEVIEGLSSEEKEKVGAFRFAMGWIIGLDFLHGSSKGDISGLIGPKGAKALAERLAVFYRNDTSDNACLWFNQVPKGFSCAMVSPTIPEIPDCSESFDRFDIVSCNEIVLKVMK